MPNIEIRTSHNIVLDKELATLFSRIFALCLDSLIQGIYIIIISNLFASVQTLIFLLVLPFLFLYHFLFELFNNGQSPGKMALKIRVIPTKGYSLTNQQVILRWLLRSVDILISFGSIALFSILSSNRSQRVGDILANTLVVKTSSNAKEQLELLEKIDNIQHQVKYPSVTILNDDEVSTVKALVKMHNDYQTEESYHMINESYNKLIDKLKISNANKKKTEFLKELIRDYIVLTK